MGKGKTVFAIVLVIVIGYFALSHIESIPIDSGIIAKIDTAFQQNWQINESISEIRNQTAKILENRTGLTPNVAKNEEKIEQEVHRLVNNERKIHGLTLLEYNQELATVAKLHSLDMAQNDFFSHVNLDGQSPTQRGADLIYYCVKINGIYVTSGIGENIFMVNTTGSKITYNTDGLAKRAVNGWMNSPGHRENILNEDYESEGIGVIISDRSIQVAQNFC